MPPGTDSLAGTDADTIVRCGVQIHSSVTVGSRTIAFVSHRSPANVLHHRIHDNDESARSPLKAYPYSKHTHATGVLK